MNAESQLRLAVLVHMVLTLCVVVYFRRRAAASGEQVSRQAEGWLLAVALRLAGLGLLLSTVGWLLAASVVHWAALPLPLGLRQAAGVAAILCPVLMYWTLSSLGRNLTDTVYVREAATLVQHGPYRWVRHPFYVVSGLLMVLVSVMSANALIAGCSAAVLILLAVRTPKEEQMLVSRFGDQYRDYMRRTGRFVPRWH